MGTGLERASTVVAHATLLSPGLAEHAERDLPGRLLRGEGGDGDAPGRSPAARAPGRRRGRRHASGLASYRRTSERLGTISMCTTRRRPRSSCSTLCLLRGRDARGDRRARRALAGTRGRHAGPSRRSTPARRARRPAPDAHVQRARSRHARGRHGDRRRGLAHGRAAEHGRDAMSAAPLARRRLLRAVVDPDHQGDRDLRGRPAARAGRAARRAQAARALPEPLRPEPRRPLRRAAAARGHRQAADEGAVPPDDVDRLPVRARADDLDPHGGRGVRAHPVRQHAGHLRHESRAVRRRRLDRAAVPVRVRRGRLLRDHARRLVLGLEVLVPRRDARRGAADLLRGLAGPRARRRDHHRADAVADGHRHRAERHVVHRAAVRRLPDLPRRRASPRRTARRST